MHTDRPGNIVPYNMPHGKVVLTTPMRILIVDDNRDILDLVQRVLAAEGYDIITARNGIEALQREAELTPDLIVLDVNLPYLDGWEVCRQIKARRSVPIIILSVRAEAIDIERSRAAGADDHLFKPFEISDLLNRIERIAGMPPK
ncbi:MAG: response regulator [Roseiflexaceae bacterium]|nr:response regulator [Roseiflexus sp.]MDW8213365.1 response regulator [Roseiflexaceae bacterium]